MDHIWEAPSVLIKSLALIFLKKSAFILRQDFLKTLYRIWVPIGNLDFGHHLATQSFYHFKSYGFLIMQDYPKSLISLSTWSFFGWEGRREDHQKIFLLFVLFYQINPSYLKVMVGEGDGLVAYKILLSVPVPIGLLGLELDFWDLAQGDWNWDQGLTKIKIRKQNAICHLRRKISYTPVIVHVSRGAAQPDDSRTGQPQIQISCTPYHCTPCQ